MEMDVTGLVGGDHQRRQVDAFETYRQAHEAAVVEPNVRNFRAAIRAYEDLIDIIKEAYIDDQERART